MGKKLTYEFVKNKFEEEGYTLLSKRHINSKTKLKYKCPKGHIHSIIWSDWCQGHRCPFCFGTGKKTIEDVRKAFENEGYVLLSNKYINSRTKLNYICPNGHRHVVRWNNWQQGQRCPVCAGKAKPPINFIKDVFEKEGYLLLTTEYKNAKTKLDYVCFEGHKHSITWNDWKTGYRCPYCARIRFGINQIGHLNPRWKGGVSFEPYCEIWKDKEFKLDIMERDAYSCLNPYCNSKNPNDLTIHHINYNKKDCHPNNLITICRSCNSAANKNRLWHKAWYQAVMYRRYGYDYN